MVFDKTGTLTEEDLQVAEIKLFDSSLETQCNEAMASCHSIAHVNDHLIGDSLDVRIFESTKWQLKEESAFYQEGVAFVRPENGNYELALLKRFDFSSQLQRMSVIVLSSYDQKYRVVTKGSPEIIKEICVKSSLPSDHD